MLFSYLDNDLTVGGQVANLLVIRFHGQEAEEAVHPCQDILDLPEPRLSCLGPLPQILNLLEEGYVVCQHVPKVYKKTLFPQFLLRQGIQHLTAPMVLLKQGVAQVQGVWKLLLLAMEEEKKAVGQRPMRQDLVVKQTTLPNRHNNRPSRAHSGGMANLSREGGASERRDKEKERERERERERRGRQEERKERREREERGERDFTCYQSCTARRGQEERTARGAGQRQPDRNEHV